MREGPCAFGVFGLEYLHIMVAALWEKDEFVAFHLSLMTIELRRVQYLLTRQLKGLLQCLATGKSVIKGPRKVHRSHVSDLNIILLTTHDMRNSCLNEGFAGSS